MKNLLSKEERMKKQSSNSKYVKAACLSLFILYLMSSFVALDFNPANWWVFRTNSAPDDVGVIVVTRTFYLVVVISFIIAPIHLIKEYEQQHKWDKP